MIPEQRAPAYRVDSKSWFLTWPHCDLSKEEVLETLKAKRPDVVAAVVAQEDHQDGSKHLHAYVLLAKRFNCTNPRFWDLKEFHGNYQKARNVDHVNQYVKKDGNFIQYGDIDWKEKVESRKDHRQYLGKRLIDGEPLEDVVRSDPSLLFGLHKLQQDVNTWKQMSLKPVHAPSIRGIWIYGPPRVGKTHYVHQTELSLYKKAQNKWWDNYTGEKAVLIDDFDKHGVCLSHYFKIWADRWSCTGEVKGGHVPLVYEKLYITSNYSIDQLFPPEEDKDLNLAIHGRFKVIHMLDRTLGLVKREPMQIE